MAERAPGRAAAALVALGAGAATVLGALAPARATTTPPAPAPTSAPASAAPAPPAPAPSEPAPADGPAPEDAPDAVGVEITELRSTPLAPDGALSVGVRVVNGTDAAVASLTAELRLQREPLATRDAVAAWSAAPADAAAGAVVLGVPLEQPLAPGTGRELVLEVPADRLGLPEDPSGWGPRGLAVDVVDARGSRLDADRGLVVWYPAPDGAGPGDLPGAQDPVRVSVVVPLTGAAPDVASALVPDEEMAALVDGAEPGSGDGRLGRLLDAAAAPGTTWALDPLLLDSSAPPPGTGTTPPAQGTAPDAGDGEDATGDDDATPPDEAADEGAGDDQPAGADPGPAPTPGDARVATGTPAPAEGVLAWRAELLEAAGSREVLALPRGDTDLLSAAAADQPELWTGGLGQGAASLERAGLPVAADPAGSGEGVRADVAWPARGELDEDAADLAALGGARGVVLAEALLDEDAPPPGGVVGVPADGADLRGLVVDERLSSVLAAAGAAPGGAAGADDVEPAALVGARLLAETAALALEQEGADEPPHALVVAPRTWDVGAAEGAAALQALTAGPWTVAAPVAALLDAPLLDTAAPGTALDLPARADGAPPALLDPEVLATAGASAERADRLGAALSDTGPLLAARLRAVAAASLAQRGADGWAEAVAAAAADVGALAGGVRLLQGGTVTVVGAEASVPVTVANDLGQAVEVVVDARATSPRVRVLGDVTADVAAGSRSQVLVPVEAVGGGDTELRLQLRTPEGAALGPPVAVPVQVRLEWAAWGTAGIAVLGALVLVAGLVRSVRRVRRRPPGSGPRAPAPDDPAPDDPAPGGPPPGPAPEHAAPRGADRSRPTSPQPQGGGARPGAPAEETR